MPCDSVRDYEYNKRLKEEWDRKRKELKRLKRIEQSKKILKEQSAKLGWTLTPKGPKTFTATKPYSTDKMEIEILDTGTIRISQDKISPMNHTSAEAFHRNIQTAVGGKVTIKSKLGTPHSHGSYEHAH